MAWPEHWKNSMKPSKAFRDLNVLRKTLNDRLKNCVPETARGSYLTAKGCYTRKQKLTHARELNRRSNANMLGAAATLHATV